MFVVKRRARLAKILEHPAFLFTRLHIRLGVDAGQSAELPESHVWWHASAKEQGVVGMRILRHDTLDVIVNGAIHRSVECLACLHPAIEHPSPR